MQVSQSILTVFTHSFFLNFDRLSVRQCRYHFIAWILYLRLRRSKRSVSLFPETDMGLGFESRLVLRLTHSFSRLECSLTQVVFAYSRIGIYANEELVSYPRSPFFEVLNVKETSLVISYTRIFWKEARSGLITSNAEEGFNCVRSMQN